MSGLVSGIVGMRQPAPAQPCVSAYNSVNDDNVTGDGTPVKVDFNIEVMDQNGDFTNDTFTAPFTGRYAVHSNVRMLNYTSSGTSFLITITATQRSWGALFTQTDQYDGGNSAPISAIIDMDAGDTFTIVFTATGDARSIEIYGTTAGPQTFVSVQLVA